MNKQTTVTIDQETAQKLDKLCKLYGLTKKDFLSLSLSYFEKHGINPAVHETPTAEMEKLRKRFDQVIAFIRTQEKEKINPMFEAITATEARIKNDLETIVKRENFNNLVNALNKVFGEIKQDANEDKEVSRNRANQQTAQTNKVAESLIMLAECLESGKDRTGLADKIKNLFTK